MRAEDGEKECGSAVAAATDEHRTLWFHRFTGLDERSSDARSQLTLWAAQQISEEPLQLGIHGHLLVV